MSSREILNDKTVTPEILTAYLDGTLTEDEARRVEEAFAASREAESYLKEMKSISGQLENHAVEIICPEPWELHELARSGGDLPTAIARHVNQCPECCEELATYRAQLRAPEPMPRSLSSMLTTPKVPEPVPEPSLFGRLRDVFLDFMVSRYRMPALALATVAASLVLVVVLYSGGKTPVSSPEKMMVAQKENPTVNGPQPVMISPDVELPTIESSASNERPTIRLSSATSTESTRHQPVLMGHIPQSQRHSPKHGEKQTRAPGALNVAFLIVFKGREASLDQQAVDDIYRYCRMDPDMKSPRIHLIDQKTIARGLSALNATKSDTEHILDTVRKKLHADALMIATINTSDHDYVCYLDVYDVASGRIIDASAGRTPPNQDLGSVRGPGVAFRSALSRLIWVTP